MRAKKQSESVPCCVLCGRSGAGVQFAIFTPRFKPFGTACVDCEKAAAPGASLDDILRMRQVEAVQ